MKIYIIVDRGFTTETRGVSGTREECREFLEHLERQFPVTRVLNEAGQEIERDTV